MVYSSPVLDLESLRNRIVACSEDIRNTPGVWDRVRRSMRHRCENNGNNFSILKYRCSYTVATRRLSRITFLSSHVTTVWGGSAFLASPENPPLVTYQPEPQSELKQNCCLTFSVGPRTHFAIIITLDVEVHTCGVTTLNNLDVDKAS
ncbi:hypothetical protein ANN_07725 [Periplaneta americana]|uniref:Uncharacterized protein n=1 Tax=Periplaneta americana TaxID=6978 RepID=A0ABQ8T0Z9_PERAM|nr:hypothetical protein ANN_07725 [Periplaneta americana]